jgi:hypothetical protein
MAYQHNGILLKRKEGKEGGREGREEKEGSEGRREGKCSYQVI